jgi:hypoxanthine phosphoribosyltransferase
VTTLFTAEQIQKRIHEMAAQINGDYADGVPLHFVAVLKGAFVFLSDLARAMAPRPITLDFIAVSSYGAATKSSGEVRLLKDLDTPLQARDVIIVEDIVDTGLTLNYLQDVRRARSQLAPDRVPAEQAEPAQSRRRGRIYRLRDRRQIRRRLWPR